jgi:hypothetical protein
MNKEMNVARQILLFNIISVVIQNNLTHPRIKVFILQPACVDKNITPIMTDCSLGCDSVSLRERFATFRRIAVPLSSTVKI